jgi:uracil-DNA glycosylase
MATRLLRLLEEVRACQHCAADLPFPPKPVLRASATARLLIVGQAPGIRVHQTGIPWNDPSGDRLRQWLGLTRDEFYDEAHVAIIPTGLCYPGKGERGDLPPRPECAPKWHPKLRAALPDVRLTLLIGGYAQAFYLQRRRRATLTATVQAWREYLPEFIPLPHPSPRNVLWLRRHAWVELEVVPAVRQLVRSVLDGR